MSTDLELARADARRAYAEMEGIHAILLEHGCEPSSDGLRTLIKRLVDEAMMWGLKSEQYRTELDDIRAAGGDALWAGGAKTLPEAVGQLAASAVYVKVMDESGAVPPEDVIRAVIPEGWELEQDEGAFRLRDPSGRIGGEGSSAVHAFLDARDQQHEEQRRERSEARRVRVELDQLHEELGGLCRPTGPGAISAALVKAQTDAVEAVLPGACDLELREGGSMPWAVVRRGEVIAENEVPVLAVRFAVKKLLEEERNALPPWLTEYELLRRAGLVEQGRRLLALALQDGGAT